MIKLNEFIKYKLKNIMKKFFLFINSLLFAYCALQAQNNYNKLIDTNKVWNYYRYWLPHPYGYSFLLRFSTDTTINQKIYHIPEYSNDSINWYKEHIWYLREEENTKQVFMYSVSDNIEGLIYDFSLTTGDTVMVFNPVYGDGFPFPYYVTSIDSILLHSSNSYRKVIYFSNNERWIEGIGHERGLHYPGDFTVGVSYNLICYYENYLLEYINLSYGYCFFISVNNESAIMHDDSFKVEYLDNKTFLLHSKYTIEEITIYDILGKIIKKNKPLSEKFIINLSSYSSGIFFLLVKINNKLYNFKILNQ